MTKKCNCNFCATDNEDNGYKHIIDELKRIRNDIDNTINLLEKRVEKDNIIDNILATDYDEYEDDVESDDTDVDELIELIKKAMKEEKRARIVIPSNVTYYSTYKPWYWY